MPKITFLSPENQTTTVTVNAGTNLRQVALQNGVPVYAGLGKIMNCHGFGMCGECAVQITDGANLSPLLRGEEKTLLRKGKNGHQMRLSCQCVIHGDLTVKTFGT